MSLGINIAGAIITAGASNIAGRSNTAGARISDAASASDTAGTGGMLLALALQGVRAIASYGIPNMCKT
jgi:hypothetical protein